ncbi:uncharacterized protein [Clytia hemisphaerica]|uniref:uncharacterized protein n=1 Tax=Clytia hemisphaerica TaxID=252671 RepID=UPI0034D6791C
MGNKQTSKQTSGLPIKMDEKGREFVNLSALIQTYDCELAHFSSLLIGREKDDVIHHFDDQFPPSNLHFPTVIKAYKSGSVSEKLDIEDSDLDYIYEIGPAIVRDKSNIALDSVENTFYHVKTPNDGFYRIEDRDGKFIYPVCLQRALYHMLKINESDHDVQHSIVIDHVDNRRDEDSPKSTEHSLNVNEKTEAPSASISSATKDKVIALRLEEWPMDIKKDFLDRNPNLEKCTEVPLFLIPKSHPESQNPMVEWRLSFSLVEKEILLNLPLSWRKVYLIIKSKLKNLNKQHATASNQTMSQNYQTPLKTYHLKTVLLWLYEKHTDFDENDIIGLLQLVVDRLLEAFSEMKLPNYFIPSQNILIGKQKLEPNNIEILKQDFSIERLFDMRGNMTCRATQLQKNGFLDNIPDNANLKLMFVAEIYNECMIHLASFLSLLFHKDKDNNLSKETENYELKLRTSSYKLVTLRFGLADIKTTKNSLIEDSWGNLVDILSALQNLPTTANNYDNPTVYLPIGNIPDWGRFLKETIDTLKLDEEKMKELSENWLAKWFNDILSEIKSGIEQGVILLNDNYNHVTHVFHESNKSPYDRFNNIFSNGGNSTTGCNTCCLTSYEETLASPVELFRKMYDVHMKNLHKMADKEIEKQLRNENMNCESSK